MSAIRFNRRVLRYVLIAAFVILLLYVLFSSSGDSARQSSFSAIKKVQKRLGVINLLICCKFTMQKVKNPKVCHFSATCFSCFSCHG